MPRSCSRVAQFRRIQQEAYAMFVKKNTDYGDAFATYGPVGVLVRIGDKLGRMRHVSKTEIVLVQDESLRDTLMDLHNYSALALMAMEDYDEKRFEPPRQTPTTSTTSTTPTSSNTPNHEDCM